MFHKEEIQNESIEDNSKTANESFYFPKVTVRVQVHIGSEVLNLKTSIGVTYQLII